MDLTEGMALLEIVHGQMYYSNNQLAETFGVSLGTVHRRKVGIEKEQKRYGNYAIISSGTNLYAYIDYDKYHKDLEDPIMRKHVPDVYKRQGYILAKQAGHKIKSIEPSLVPFEMKENWCKELMGLTLKNVMVRITTKKKTIYEGFGEFLFTHFGVDVYKRQLFVL